MRLVNKHDDRGIRVLDLVNNIFQSILELPLDARTGFKQSNIQTVNLYGLKKIGDITLDYPLSQRLHNRRLSHPRLTNKDRVVFALTR